MQLAQVASSEEQRVDRTNSLYLGQRVLTSLQDATTTQAGHESRLLVRECDLERELRERECDLVRELLRVQVAVPALVSSGCTTATNQTTTATTTTVTSEKDNGTLSAYQANQDVHQHWFSPCGHS